MEETGKGRKMTVTQIAAAIRKHTNSSGITFVDPQLAALLLKNNDFNRKIRKPYVRQLSHKMRSGEFVYNGDTIRIGKGGTLLDGQHRLLACIDSGRSFNTIIACDVDETVMHTIDRGSKRTMGDILRINGEKYSNQLAASLLWVHKITSGPEYIRSTGRKYGMTEMETLDLLDRWPDVRGSLLVFHEGRSRFVFSRGAAKISSFAALRTVVGRTHPGIHDFFDKCISGVGLELGDPILALRERLAADNMVKGQSAGVNRPWVPLYYVVRAWNSWAKGKTLKRISLRDDEFPAIYSGPLWEK